MIAGASIRYVLSRALLTLFKAKARRDRYFDIRTKGATMNLSRLEWLRGKHVKDGSDIIALLDDKNARGRERLLNGQVDFAQMKRIASAQKITDLVRETLQEVLKNDRAISLYNRPVDRKALLQSVEALG